LGPTSISSADNNYFHGAIVNEKLQ